MQTTSRPEVDLIERLMSSFGDLERAISRARAELARTGRVPGEVFDRLDSYDDIIARQRSLTEDLGQFVRSGDVEQVVQRVAVINGLSGMIIDDAKAILSAFQLGMYPVAPQTPFNYC